MIESSALEVIETLNRAYSRTPILTIVLALTFAAALVAGLSFGSSWGATAIFGATALLVLPCAHRGESSDHSIELEYALAPDASRAYRKLSESFQRFARCRAVWHVQRKTGKQGQRIVRRRIQPRLGLPPRVKSNVRVPTLRAGRQRLYFFPDRVVIYDAQMVWAVPYGDLRVEAGETRLTEGIREPGGDSRGSARAGTPERPTVHGVLRLRSSSGLAVVFRCSSPQVTNDFASALTALQASHRALQQHAPALSRAV
jgi:hypothetical protein